ncbi:MAG: hypothetical protein V3V08_17065 [Nannocystaceae bacterium]
MSLEAWWPESTANSPVRLRTAHVEYSFDASKLALAVWTSGDSVSRCAVFLFDLASAGDRAPTIHSCVSEMAFSPNAEYLATYGWSPNGAAKTAFRMWRTDTLAIVGERRLPVTWGTSPRRPTPIAFVKQRSLADDSGLGHWNYRHGLGETFHLQTSGRLLMRTIHSTLSFQLAGGVEDWFPETLLFGEGGTRSHLGEACAATISFPTNEVRTFGADPEKRRTAVTLPGPILPTEPGARFPRLVSSPDCRHVAVLTEDGGRVFRTSDGTYLFDIGTGPEGIFLLRTHVVSVAGGVIGFRRFSDGVETDFVVEAGSTPPEVGPGITWQWRELRGEGFRPVAAELRRTGGANDPDGVQLALWQLNTR